MDTEFIREKTYWPVLCLIQIAWSGGAVAVDPLARGLDLSPLLAVLSNPNIVKIFHAARQDLEIFYRLMGRLPMPIADTQIMALALGHGEQMAYDRLIAAVLGRKLSKGSRYTDWARRPLSDAQMDYALGDVTHLLDAFHAMIEKMEKQGRMEWVTDQHADMLDEKHYKNDPQSAWQRVKIRSDDPRVLGRLRAIAAWREERAQARDLPRPWVMKDEVLTELALSAPRDVDALLNVRGLGKISPAQAEDFLSLLRSAEPITLPPPPAYQPAPPAVIELLRVLLSHVAEQENINPKLIASSDDLNNFALGLPSPLATGWHYEAFGRTAEALMNGTLALKIEGKKLAIVDASGNEKIRG